MPKMFAAVLVPCLRRLIPGDVCAVPVLVLPPVVLPLILAHTVVLPEAEPESTRMPARDAVVVAGAATVLPRIFALGVQFEFRAIAKMPGPSVWLTLFPLIVVVRSALAVVVVKLSASQPIPIPADATALFAAMKLLFTVDATFVAPKAESSITTPSM